MHDRWTVGKNGHIHPLLCLQLLNLHGFIPIDSVAVNHSDFASVMINDRKLERNPDLIGGERRS